MTDYRTMYDKDYIGAWDFQGDTVVTIMDVQSKKIKNVQTNKEDRKPIITLEGYDKRWVCNLTNGAIIAQMYGSHVEKWRGKSVTIFPTQTQAFGRMQDCIRVRPSVPDVATKKVDNGQPLFDLDGSEAGRFPNPGKWLDAFEPLSTKATAATAATFWDANQDVFFKVHQFATNKSEDAMIERLNAAGKAVRDLIPLEAGETVQA